LSTEENTRHSRHFRRSYLKANKLKKKVKLKRQGELNTRIIFETVLMLFTQDDQN